MSADKPPASEEVILFKELNVPEIVCESKDPAPFANYLKYYRIQNFTAMLPCNGPPLTIPSIGFSNKSITPVPILVNNPTGLPRISIDPKTLKKDATRDAL